MTLQQIGNLGEFIGGIAVIVSLIYLAIQLRQNTQSVRSATYQSILSSAAACNVTITQSPDLARVMRMGSEDFSNLDEDQRVRFSFLCAQFFDIYENLYLQYTHGSLDDDFWLPRSRAYIDLLDMPGIAAWWDLRKGGYSTSFTRYVETERAAHGDGDMSTRLFLSDPG